MATLAATAATYKTVLLTTISTAIDLGEFTAFGITIPAGWTTANLTFQVSNDNVTWYDMYDSFGSEYTVTAAASRAILLPVVDFVGFRYLKIRSGTSAAGVTQGSERTLYLITLSKT